MARAVVLEFNVNLIIQFQKDETAKVVYRYGISITGTTNNFIIDEAIMNVSFSAPSEFDSFKENKASIFNFNIYIVVILLE